MVAQAAFLAFMQRESTKFTRSFELIEDFGSMAATPTDAEVDTFLIAEGMPALAEVYKLSAEFGT